MVLCMYFTLRGSGFAFVRMGRCVNMALGMVSMVNGVAVYRAAVMSVQQVMNVRDILGHGFASMVVKMLRIAGFI
jgi:hypothetical protein